MALGSFAGSFSFSAAGHIHTFLPDKITVGALTGISDSFVFGTPTGKLQASNTGLSDPFAFGTQISKLQVSGIGLSDPTVFGTQKCTLQANCTGLADAITIGTSFVVFKDWSVVVAPTSTDMAVVTAASGTDFTEVSNEGSL